MAENTAYYTPTILRDSSRITRRWGVFTKRLFDLCTAMLGLIFLAPLFAIIALRIKRSSPGPVFYRGRRVGLGGKEFKILKFRTMYERPESYQGPCLTGKDDCRITSLGHWLRDTKINELPQLWNVLKGEMSIVGPRPEDPHIVQQWPGETRDEILSMRPGISSPASVLYRHEESLLKNTRLMESYFKDILPSKLRLDQLYIRHHSFWSDLDVIFWTLLVLFPKLQACSPAEGHLLFGPVARIARRHLNWFTLDLGVTFIAISVTGLFWRSFQPLNVGWMVALSLAVGFALLFSLVNALLKVNHIDWTHASSTDIIDLLPGAVVATLIALLAIYLLPDQISALTTGIIAPWWAIPIVPPALIIMAAALSFGGYVGIRYRSRLVTGFATRWVAWRAVAPFPQERVLIVGGGDTGQLAAWMITTGQLSKTFSVVGFVDDDLYKQDIRIRGTKVLGKCNDLPDIAAKFDVGIILFAIHKISVIERRRLLELCSQTSARVVLFPDLRASLNQLAEHSLLNANPEPKSRTYQAAPSEQLPCHLCLTKISPIKVDRWLEQLEESAIAGDLQTVLGQIHAMRDHLSSDVHEQVSANLPG